MYTTWDYDKKITGIEKAILTHSLLPEYQWIEAQLAPDEIDVESYERLAHIREKLETFYDRLKNNVLICGKNLGCGKTSWAIKLMLTHVENNEDRLKLVDASETDKFDIALFVSSVPFLVEIKQFSDNKQAAEVYQRAKKSELVVFDDIAAVNMSNYDYNILYALIESRTLAHLPSIFTSNATSEEELTATLGPRLADRIWNTSTVVELKGKGFRGTK